MFSSFIVCLNQNRSAIVRELLSNNSPFVSQLYEDKSLALRARDLIFFTTDLKNCELFLNNSRTIADLFLKYNKVQHNKVNI